MKTKTKPCDEDQVKDRFYSSIFEFGDQIWFYLKIFPVLTQEYFETSLKVVNSSATL